MSNVITTLQNMFMTPQPQPPAPAPATSVASPTSVPASGNPTVPGNPNTGEPLAPASPMDKHQTLWQNDPNKKPATPQPLFNLDPKAMADAASKLDFSQAITPELAARIKAGGEDGMAAMMQAMNTVAQTTFAQSTASNALLIEEAVKKTQKEMLGQLPSLIKQHAVRSSINENPALSNPAVKPMVDLVTKQVQQKNPTATEAELRALVSDYFDSFGKMITANQEANAPKPALSKGEDFSEWA